jgi:putative transposase
MPKLKHIHLPEFPYLITTVTLNRKPIFENPNAADILLKAILFGRKKEWYSLLSFVIMPDHMHLIIVPTNKNVSECMQSLKGFRRGR